MTLPFPNQTFLADTGPLVAFLNRRDHFHSWAKDQLGSIQPPMLTCEAVLTEACHLLRHSSEGSKAILELLERDLLRIAFRLDQEASAVSRLMTRYADLPMSLADACIVRMAEIHNRSKVLTLDSDFQIYRMHGRKIIPALLPRTMQAD